MRENTDHNNSENGHFLRSACTIDKNITKAFFEINLHCTKNQVNHYEFLQQMWQNPQETADLVAFTEEILNG